MFANFIGLSPLKKEAGKRDVMLKKILLVVVMLGFMIVQAKADEGRTKLVVLGFDGADYPLVTEMMEQGELPNLKKLAEKGSFHPLLPTNPPQTPVSWSTFATGLNPGETEILDFIKRKENSYLPTYALQGETSKDVLFGERNAAILPVIGFFVVFLASALLSFFIFRRKGILLRLTPPIVLACLAAWAVFWVASNWLPEKIPAAVVVRKGKPIWQILEEHDKSATIVRLPVTFPAEPLKGEMISGLPVPDIKATVGKPSIYTTNQEWIGQKNKFSVEVIGLQGQSPFQVHLIGPPNKLFYDSNEAEAARKRGEAYLVPKELDVPMTLAVRADQVEVQLQDSRFILKEKDWSNWITVTYEFNPIVKVKGFVRFYLDSLNPEIKLYATPVNLHPDNPLPLSYPQDLAKRLWAEEPYKTLGWAIDTWSIGSDLMDEEQFLSDMYLTVDRFEKLMVEFLDNPDRDLLVQVFSFTDRICHVLWRYMDVDHPRYDAQKAPIFQKAIRDSYRRMDSIVGIAMERIDFSNTELIVCSDHGFASFRYQVNFNTWLVKNGYMTLKKNVLGVPMELDDLTNGRSPFTSVDWEKTKAYALGLGMIFINLEGREPQGSVRPEEYDAVCREISEKLEAFVDEKTGLNPIRKVYLRKEMYSRFDAGITPDLRVATAVPYRVSWDTTLGGMPVETTGLNNRTWSGDHCSLDPQDVKGVLFSTRPISKVQPEMIDMCPSMLHILGITPPGNMEGDILFQ